MSIEGVPKGWKIKAIKKHSCDKHYINKLGEAQKCLGGLCDFSDVVTIIERDVQVIDMSQCLVDVEYECEDSIGDKFWAISSDSKSAYPKVRVRQDHYFGWQGGECPLPDGLIVELSFRGGEIACKKVSDASKYCWTHGLPDITDSDIEIIGFEVLGTADTHAYAHELKVKNNPDPDQERIDEFYFVKGG